ncbi:MAG: ATP-grasp fold amidoligase family protein [Alphaproteobacteria bacterium]
MSPSKRIKRIRRAFFDGVIRLLPYNRWGDRIAHFLQFVRAHRRLPGDFTINTDVLHEIKRGGELLNPLRVFTTDKELAKIFTEAVVGKQYVVPTLHVLRTVEEIDAYDFPANCCIKPTHSCGRVILRRDNQEIDKNEIKGWLSHNYYRQTREVNYRDLIPKVIVEEVVFPLTEGADYKFFCYKGQPNLIEVHIGRFGDRGDHRQFICDTNWNWVNGLTTHSMDKHPVDKPDNLQSMLEVASKIAAYFEHVRVDMYSDGDHCYVGEITHCAGGACIPVSSVDAERELSKVILREPIDDNAALPA